MSWLSDFVRSTTGGLGVGETIGGTVGSLFGPAGAATGARLGGAVTEFIDISDNTEGQATARSISGELPRETGMSGQRQMYGPQMGMPTYQAGGVMLPGMFSTGLAAARQALGRGVGAGGTAFGVGALALGAADVVLDAFGQPKKLVITRKMQREVKELYHYLNMDMNAVAQAYSAYKGMNFSPAQIQRILLKRFRNDGPYVTKAAIRKTRSTVRKLERLEALKKQITGTRAAPRRRAAATTRITQVK